MPFKFVDDGYPDADDYASNYVWVENGVEECPRVKRRGGPSAPRANAPDAKPRRPRLPWWLGGGWLRQQPGSPAARTQ